MKRNGTIAAVILAAGCASRMGRAKSMLSLGKSNFLGELASRYRQAGIEAIRVVVGHGAEEVTPFLDDLDVPWVLNPDYRAGMFSSVRTGIQCLPPGTEAFFVHPVDIPLVKPGTIAALASAFRDGDAAIVYPCFLGRRGHPPLIASRCTADLPLDVEGGLQAYLRRYEARALDVEVIDQAVVMDCDTPEDYRILEAYRNREAFPTVRECEAIWRRVRGGDGIPAHGRLVAELARLLAVHLNRAGAGLDIPLVIAGGCLHDLMKGKPDHARAGARVLGDLDYPRVAAVVSAHMDIRPGKGTPNESELVYLADKCAQGDRLVSLNERFDARLATFAGKPEVLEAITRRFYHAQVIQERIETLLNRPLAAIIEKHRRGLTWAVASGRRRIYLVRHGAVRIQGRGKRFIGQLDVPLSEEGERQALSLQEALRTASLGAIYCSDLNRSMATAEIIAAPHGLRITPRKALREIALGRWEGHSFAEIRMAFPDAFEERGRDIAHFRPPGGENFFDCTCRVLPALYDLLQSSRGDLLIVGHAGVNRVLLCHVLGRPLEDLFEFPQDYGCLNIIEVTGGTFTASGINRVFPASAGEPRCRMPG